MGQNEIKNSRISRRDLLGGGLKLAGGAALAATMPATLLGAGPFASAAGAASTTAMSFQLGWITNAEFAGTYLAQALNYYKGIDLTILPGGSNPVEPIVASGKALVGDTNADIVSAAVAQGASALRIIGARYQLNPFCIISNAKKPLKTPKDLIGKKVGVNAYNLTAWNIFLKLNGIKPTQVTTVNEGFTSGPTPLSNGQVDAWMGFYTNEPGVLSLAGFPNYVFLMADFGYHVFADVYITTEDAIKNQKDLLVAFMQGERDGWNKDIANPAAGTKLTVARFGKKLALDPKQTALENTSQKTLMVTPYTEKHGLFAMNPVDIAKNIATLKAGSSATTPYFTNPSLFDSSILAALKK